MALNRSTLDNSKERHQRNINIIFNSIAKEVGLKWNKNRC